MSEEKMQPDQDMQEKNSDTQLDEKELQQVKTEPEADSTDEALEEKAGEGEEEENEQSEDEFTKLQKEVEEAKDKYIRLFSEFENFRRRTARERLDLIQTSTENLMVELLPVLDDFNRAKESLKEGGDMKSVEQGLALIENKLKRSLEMKGLKAMQVKQGDDFNPELHEGVSQIPAPKKKWKGKVVDIIEDGYFLGEKVIRFAKVVIGS